MIYTVKNEDAGQRLDTYLSSQSGRTRSAVQKMIGQGRVLVNGKRPTKTGYPTAVGDSIEVLSERTVTQEEGGTFRLLDETPEYLVIEKPAGLIVHAAPSREQTTLVDLLLTRFPEIRDVGDDPVRPGVVHRLDKDASGVMVIARTQESFDSLKRQFKLRRVTKEYLVCVYGTVKPDNGTIAIPITRPSAHTTRFVGSMQKGRQAITNYEVEEHFDGYTLVRVRPETGRTHQIRVHFYSKGYPLVGDRVYKSPKVKKPLDTRLMLHAFLLEFRDAVGNSRRYECPPPQDFQAVLELIDKK